jgi:hypothetical protein
MDSPTGHAHDADANANRSSSLRSKGNNRRPVRPSSLRDPELSRDGVVSVDYRLLSRGVSLLGRSVGQCSGSGAAEAAEDVGEAEEYEQGAQDDDAGGGGQKAVEPFGVQAVGEDQRDAVEGHADEDGPVDLKDGPLSGEPGEVFDAVDEEPESRRARQAAKHHAFRGDGIKVGRDQGSRECQPQSQCHGCPPEARGREREARDFWIVLSSHMFQDITGAEGGETRFVRG